MTQFHAQPYSLDRTGFYFDSIETFERGMKRLNNQGCEEVEIQFSVHIPAHREHPFWFNVKTCSGRT